MSAKVILEQSTAPVCRADFTVSKTGSCVGDQSVGQDLHSKSYLEIVDLVDYPAAVTEAKDQIAVSKDNELNITVTIHKNKTTAHQEDKNSRKFHHLNKTKTAIPSDRVS